MYKPENRQGEAQAARRLVRLIREDKSVFIRVHDGEEMSEPFQTEAQVWDAMGGDGSRYAPRLRRQRHAAGLVLSRVGQ